MNASHLTLDRTPERVSAFVEAFFGAGNTVWPDRDPTSKSGRNLVPFLQVLYSGTDVPVILPRRRPAQEDRLTAYVIALDQAHATAVSELLTSFVGPSYTYFDGRPARLDSHDPIDRAVLEFAGPGTTFTLASPITKKDKPTWDALRLLQQTVGKRPIRAWHVPKPIGRLLAEFETALAAGDHTASAQVLEQLTASGGLTGPNLAHLRIKRLARLGRDRDLLQLAGLDDVIAAAPPAPVADAVLTAIFTHALADPLSAGDLTTAQTNLIDRGRVVPALMHRDLGGLGAQALTVLALAALVRNDVALAHRMLTHPSVRGQIDHLAPSVVTALANTNTAATNLPDDELTHEVPSAALAVASEQPPSTWTELAEALAADGDGANVVMADEAWREWPAPAATDQELAAILGRLDDSAAERTWSVVGAFLDADGYQQPATRSAYELIQNALTHNRFSPGDLAGLVALTEIALRAGPSRQDYTALLDDLCAECDRWVGPERATVALDLADLLVRSASPDQEARLRLAIALLEPLHAHHGRLDATQIAFGSQLSKELQTGLVWPHATVNAETTGALADLASQRVLLYSLNKGALTRTAEALNQLAPAVKIHLSHDHVGNPQLKQHARNADLIVLATRCATHAATGLIRACAAKGATVTEADGSGSASLLRAAVTGLLSRSA